jgi:hypothetical protein
MFNINIGFCGFSRVAVGDTCDPTLGQPQATAGVEELPAAGTGFAAASLGPHWWTISAVASVPF